MKNKSLYLLSLLVTLFITVCSCKDDKEELPDVSRTITFPSSEDTNPTFSSEGGTSTISFTAGGDWTANLTNTRTDNWITIEPTSGEKGNAQITIRTTANETYDSRSTSIVLKCGTNADTISVYQVSKNAIIVARNEYYFNNEGGELNFKVQSNLDFDVTTSDSWIQRMQSTTRGLTEYNLSFTILANSTNRDRQGTIIVKDKISSKQQIIVIKQIYIDPLAREALIALYKATGGDHWINNTNWCSDKPLNEWYGIETDIKGISSINLSNNGLVGSLPEEIGNIKELRFLYLYGNELSGKIPNSIGETDLRGIYLHDNQLSGEIPEEIGKLTNLIYLSLNTNSLSGFIPKSIGNLTKLESLSLGNNRLTGTIPTEIGNLTLLETFDIGNSNISGAGGTIIIDPETGEVIGGIATQNSISGLIPIELCKLPNLKILYMDGNKLSGEIPEEIWSIPSLTYLGLSQNLLTGQISPSIRNAKILKQLLLHNNLLTGTLPDEICELSNLEELRIDNTTHRIVAGQMVENTEYNHITGNLPEKIGNLKKLKQLFISNVGLTGELPKSIWSCESIEELALTNAGDKYPNTFTGTIPEEIVNLKNLAYFSITGNKFTGTIPKSISKLTNLGVIALNENNLEGVIPEDIGNLTNLSTFWVSYNNLSGTIPESVCNLINLQSFFISGNKIEGTIPELVGNLKKLETFWAHKNNLVGNIPIGFAELPDLRGLILNGNRLNGVVPKEIVQLPMWDTYNIESDLLPQQEGYGLTIDNGEARTMVRNSFVNRNSETISRSYQVGKQIVFETEHGRQSIAVLKKR